MFKRALMAVLSLAVLPSVRPCLAQPEQVDYEKRALGFIELLKSSDVEVRRKAARDLAARASPHPQAVAALIAALKGDEDKTVRQAAARGLGWIGPARREVIPAMIEAMNDDDRDVRHSVAQALALVGPAAARAMPALRKDAKRVTGGVHYPYRDSWADLSPKVTERINDRVKHMERFPFVETLADARKRMDAAGARCSAAHDEVNRVAAARGRLEQNRRATVRQKQYLAAQHDAARKRYYATWEAWRAARQRWQTAQARVRAARHLIWPASEHGSAARGIMPVLIRYLRDKEDEVAAQAAKGLGCMGPAARRAVPELVALLQDHSRGRLARAHAAWALRNMGPAAEEATYPLTRALEDGQELVRVAAAGALNAVAPDLMPPVDVLIQALKGEDSFVRGCAVTELMLYGPKATRAVPAIVEQCKYPATDWSYALGTLHSIGPATKQELPALIELLKHENGRVRQGAARALWIMGAEAKDATAALIEALADAERGVRLNAAMALYWIGPDAKDAAPALSEMLLKDTDTLVRQQAASALGNIRPAAAIAVPALIKALGDSDARVRSSAATALRDLGLAAKQAAPALTEATKDKDRDVRRWAANALHYFADLEWRVSDCIRMLKHQQAHYRKLAAEQLGGMGPDAEGGIPALEEALGDEDESVREAAAEALKQIRGVVRLAPAMRPATQRARNE